MSLGGLVIPTRGILLPALKEDSTPDMARTEENSAAFERQRALARDALRIFEDPVPVGIMEFVESDKYLNLKDYVYPAAKWILKSFYEPQDCYEDFRIEWAGKSFCYPGFGSLGYTQAEVDAFYFNRLVGMIGMRFGKSVLSAVAVLYEAYKLLCLEDPTTMAEGLAPGSPIVISVGATSQAQSEGTVYAYVNEWRNNSPWFQQYIQACKAFKIGRHSAYEEHDLEFRWWHKNVIIDSVHSNSGTLRGRTRAAVVIDEIAHFDDGAKKNADNAHDALVNSTKSFGSRGKAIMISSPVHIADKISRLFSASGVKVESAYYEEEGWSALSEFNGKPIEVDGSMLGFHFPTWELNPVLPRSAFTQDFLTNPEGSRRDFGALPSQAKEAFFSNPGKVDEAFDTRPCPVDDMGRIATTFQPKAGVRAYHLHVDVGAGHPSNFGIVLAHEERRSDGEGGTFPVCVVDLAYAVKADADGEMDYERAREILDYIIDKFPDIHYSSDRWNDEEYRSKIRKKVRKLDAFTVGIEHYDELKNLIYKGSFICHHSPQLSEELKRLELVNGKKVEKGLGYTKDVADGAAAVAKRVIEKAVNRPVSGRAIRGVMSR